MNVNGGEWRICVQTHIQPNGFHSPFYAHTVTGQARLKNARKLHASVWGHLLVYL